MAVISEALQNNVALMIAELWVANCGLSAKGSLVSLYMVKSLGKNFRL